MRYVVIVYIQDDGTGNIGSSTHFFKSKKALYDFLIHLSFSNVDDVEIYELYEEAKYSLYEE